MDKKGLENKATESYIACDVTHPLEQELVFGTHFRWAPPTSSTVALGSMQLSRTAAIAKQIRMCPSILQLF